MRFPLPDDFISDLGYHYYGKATAKLIRVSFKRLSRLTIIMNFAVARRI
jgi:hypothetical protein